LAKSLTETDYKGCTVYTTQPSEKMVWRWSYG